MPTCIYICQHVICSATCRHACTRCVCNMHARSAKHSASLHPPTCIPSHMRIQKHVSIFANHGILRLCIWEVSVMSYAQLRVLACCRYHFHFDFVIMEHINNLLEEASDFLRSQGCLETSLVIWRRPRREVIWRQRRELENLQGTFHYQFSSFTYGRMYFLLFSLVCLIIKKYCTTLTNMDGSN